MFSDQFIHISVTLFSENWTPTPPRNANNVGLLYNSPTVLALRGDVGVQFSEKSVTDILMN